MITAILILLICLGLAIGGAAFMYVPYHLDNEDE